MGGALYPFEFHLVGSPLSTQASAGSKERWKRSVRNAAENRRDQITEWTYLEERPLALTIYYFPIAPMTGDIDNIVKPIADALIGTIYIDDRQIERVAVQKFEPDVDWTFEDLSVQLDSALNSRIGSDGASPVVYVRVDDDLRWRSVR